MYCTCRRFFITTAKRAKKVAPTTYGDTGVIKHDRFRIFVKAGAGGNGIPKYNGTGGDGGDVYVSGTPKLLFHQLREQFANRRTLAAENGGHAIQTKLVGEKGSSLTIRVPVGVEVVNRNNNLLLARCTQPFQRHLIARGGEGGSASNDYKGSRGDALLIDLHLKLRPNIGLVGFPNAGKSTLLKALVPKQKVKIASYPFTTTRPQLSFMKDFEEELCDDDKENFSLSIADLPGLIEGASRNRGKGTEFLKHLEYSDILLLIVDVNGFRLSASLSSPFRSALETTAILNLELESYDASLIRKPALLVINKIDLPDGIKKAEELSLALKRNDWLNLVPESLRPKTPLKFNEIVSISAKEGQLSNLKAILVKMFSSLNPLTDPFDDISNNRRGSKNIPRLV